MANIKKSFNFRSGVQVDDDNLKVTPTGLVGIGTTVPIEALDVRGNAVISGITSSVFGKVGFLTVTTLEPTQIVGAGISIASGIITNPSMDATGIVTYFGDGRFLQGLPTSQWEDTNAGFGVSSIYNTGGTVGIATTNPQFTLQVGNNPNAGEIGVGISSAGDIKASGIVTATGFVGALTGNVTGNLTGVAASTTQLETARTIGGVSFDGTSNIDLAGVNIAGNQNTSGTAANLSGTPNILINNLSAAGISTLGVTTTSTGSNFHFGNHVFVKDEKFLYMGDDSVFRIGHHAGPGHSQIKHDSAAQDLVLAADRIRIINRAENKGLASFTEGGQVVLKYDGNDKLKTSGIGVTIYNQLDTTNIVASGVITATTELNSPLIGVGTDSPSNDIQVRKSSNAEIQVTSDTGVAGLTVGREAGTGDTNNAEFRYGGGAGASYSSSQSLDILNYGTGNFNYHISANNAGAVAGDFHWHRGKNNVRLMTLTGIGGSLGIGITTPTQALHVAGNGFIAGNLTVDDTLTASTLVVNSTVNFSNVICGTVAGTLLGNTNSTSGISTFNTLKTTSSTSNFAGIGIKTDNTSNLPLDIFGDGASTDKRLFVTSDARIGIKTDEINPGIDINAVDSRVSIQSMGVGTTNPQSAVDMRFAGQELTGIFANRMYMYPPQVNTSQRGNLAGVAAGAVIYNTSTNKLQVYNGSAWQDCN